MAEWDSLYIYYISGTGNARISAQWIADEAGQRGLKCVVRQIDRLENIDFPSPAENPLIGFAFPTHGFNAAPIMLRFIAGFPARLAKNVFLLNTRAGMKMGKIFLPGLTGLALVIPALILRLKGYKCIGFRPVDLPSNWIPLHPGIKQKVIESIFRRCEPIVRNFANQILDGKKIYSGLRSLPLDLLISPIAMGYYIGGRFFLSKTFMANNKCTNCGICIKECPTSSISLVMNRPYWKLTCESCMRCLNHCPEKAIEATHGLAIVFIVLISAINTWLILSLAGIFGIPSEALWWKLATQVIYIVVMVFTAAALYMAMHVAMAFRPLRYLVQYTSLTSLKSWRRYNFLKGRKNKNESKNNKTLK
jgi:NAD-dependent dihydropyrimidine dehydrogenase PreA subunit